MMSEMSKMGLAVLMLLAGREVGVGQTASVASQVEPAVGTLKAAVQGLTVEKWKAPKPVKDSTAANLNSIRKDVMETLPGLVGAADAAPASVAAMIPVERNLAALYDVVLRVMVIADAAAPEEQTVAIQDAMRKLEDVRRSFGDRLQTQADGQERQMMALQKTASVTPPSAVAPVCPATAPVPTKKVVKKPVPAAAPPPV